MKQKDLLLAAREGNYDLSLGSGWVEALVLRRYQSGRAENLRVDDSTRGELEVPEDCSHVLIVLELPITALLNGLTQEVAPRVLADSHMTTQ